MQSIEKGALWLFTANISFFVSSFLISLVLGRFLFSASEFGIFTVTISLVSLIAATLATGIQQAVSKFISAEEESAFSIRQKMFFYQFFFGLFVSAGYFMLAEPIAFLLNDAALVPYIQLSAAILLFHPLIGVVNGTLNGLGKFSKQALFAIIYYALKTVFMIGLVIAGFHIMGAIAGFVLISLFSVIIGFFMTRLPEKKSEIEFGKIVFFAAPLVVFAMALNFFQNIGLFAIKAFSAANADALAGNYSIAMTIASIPPIALLAVNFVALPVLSKTISQKNRKKTGFYLRESMRYSLLFLGFCTAILASMPKPIIELVFSEKFSLAYSGLAILAFAYLFFGLFQLLATAITAYGRPRVPLAISAAMLATAFALSMLLVPSTGIEGAAIASLITMFLAFLIAAIFVFSKFGTLVSAKSCVRITIASAIVFFAARAIDVSGAILVLWCLALLGIYAGVLFCTRELKQKDLKVFKNMIK